MRSAEEMLDAVLSFARADDRILAVGMEGSRVNVNIPPDAFQDYDITYFVRSIGAFTGDDGWLARFGRPLLIQKPEDMELYPAEEPGYSYLMLFDDYVKLDLTLLEPKDLPAYLAQDRLRTILLDKCGLVGPLPPPTDADYWLQKPSARALEGPVPPRAPLRRRPFAPAAARAAADAGLVGGVRLRLFLFARKKL